MNLITVGGAFGFATLVFQNGWGTSLIGIESQGFVDAWAPLFFFALLFGLSMDYQLFLLAAIRERFQSTGDTRRSIEEGIARTGRPITNAAEWNPPCHKHFLTDLLVLELGHRLAVSACGSVLSELGCEVVSVFESRTTRE